MRVPNLVPIGPQAATCIRPEGYTHRQTDRQTDTHTLSYIDIDLLLYRDGLKIAHSNSILAICCIPDEKLGLFAYPMKTRLILFDLTQIPN